MNWLFQMHTAQPVAHDIGVLALVCVAGMAVGSLKVRGVGLGTAGVLFAGILAGYFGKPVDHATLEFVKEFGLILFVFTIGLQLGPGFLAALRQQGLVLNALAATVVALGALTAAVSRRRRCGEAEVHLAAGGPVFTNGGRLGAGDTGAMLDGFRQVVGRPSDEALRQAPGDSTASRVVVTNKRAL